MIVSELDAQVSVLEKELHEKASEFDELKLELTSWRQRYKCESAEWRRKEEKLKKEIVTIMSGLKEEERAEIL